MEGNSRMNPYTRIWEASEDMNSQSAPSIVPVISVDICISSQFKQRTLPA